MQHSPTECHTLVSSMLPWRSSHFYPQFLLLLLLSKSLNTPAASCSLYNTVLQTDMYVHQANWFLTSSSRELPTKSFPFRRSEGCDGKHFLTFKYLSKQLLFNRLVPTARNQDKHLLIITFPTVTLPVAIRETCSPIIFESTLRSLHHLMLVDMFPDL